MTSTETDLTLVLTAHDETLVSGPTIKSAEAAVNAARAAGMTVEMIVALDCATPQTTSWFNQPALGSWTKMVFEEGDLGRVRNAILPLTKGRFIAFLDADDLFSENWLRDGVLALRKAADAGKRAIAHPELNWLFDGTHSVFLNPNQADQLFTPWHFYCMNYYDSLCIAPREAHLEHPYVHRDIPRGLSFQDWQFSIETMAAGWEHVSAPDTVIFKRRRDSSLVTESRSRRALVRQLEPMRFDKVDQLSALSSQIPGDAGQDIPDASVAGKQAWRRVLAALLRYTAPHFSSPPDIPLPPEPGEHLGPVFAARVARAKARRARSSITRSYKLLEKHFDYAYYLACHPDILRQEQVDPLAHYLRAGHKEGRKPAPWFSDKAYRQRYPDVAESGEVPFVHYLRAGRAEGRIATPFGMTAFDNAAQVLGKTTAEAAVLWQQRYTDLRQRLEHGELGRQIRQVEDLEPLVGLGWREALQVKVPPFNNDIVMQRTGAMWQLAQAAGGPVRFVICVNRARFGNAPRMEGHIARSLAALHGADSVLMLTTDESGTLPESKLPEGVRHVDFADLARHLKGEQRQRLLAEFLRGLHPDAVFNVNSRLFWDVMTPYGTALSASMHLYGCLFCNEQGPTGHWSGYPLRRFYRHFEQLSGVLTDSEFLASDLSSRFMLPPDLEHKLMVLGNPVDTEIPVATHQPTDSGRPQIFWAGRLDRQKRVDLALAIARAMPECDLRMWGGDALPKDLGIDDLPDNVTFEGYYENFEDLPMAQADAWLYTSAWDGVPTILLETAMTGVPILASDAGGTGEIIPAGQLMAGDATPEDWAAALRQLFSNGEASRAKALELRTRLAGQRTAAAHAAVLTEVPGCRSEISTSPAAEVSA